MKTYLTLALVAMSFTVYTQNYQLNGNLGLGTVPENKLDVSGDSKMDGKLTVTQETKLEGNTEIDGVLKVPNLAETETGYFIMADEQGIVKKMLLPSWFSEIAGDLYVPGECSLFDVNSKWISGENLLYTCQPETKVGIGTDAPQHALDVSGSARVDYLYLSDAELTNNYTFGSLSTSLNPYNFRINSGDKFGLGINVDGTELKNGLSIYNNDQNVFRVFSNGVISSTVPSDAWTAFQISNEIEKIFEVNSLGHVYSRKVVVTLDNFPDYVFDLDYKLMPLMELETYIQKNKHLPNMPSSTEVAENGGDIGEISRVSVEKIEELTLYTLQQQKELEQQESELAALKAETALLKQQLESLLKAQN